MFKAPTAMIVLASEQLWPNLHGLVHWSESLKHLFIYHTSDTKRSATPAQQLKKFCQLQFPHFNIHAPDGDHGMMPEDVRKQVERWLRDFPGLQWVFNATGGTKPMHVGALPFGANPSVAVVYRELANQWFELQAREGEVRYQPIDVPLTATDAIPVDILIRTQWESDDTAVEFGARPRPLPIDQLVQAGIDTRWNWVDAFGRVGLPTNSQGGFLFEEFLAGVLLEMGLKNLVVNVKRCGQGNKSQQEIDLVVNQGGRIVILDCKLRSEAEEGSRVEGITSQIRQGAQTRRDLGGLGATYIMIRPARRFDDDQRQLAELSGLRVLDQGDMRVCFTRLAELLNVNPLPDSLRRAEQLMQQSLEQGGAPLFAGESRALSSLTAGSQVDVLFNLDELLQQFRTSRNQDWSAHQYRNRVVIHCVRKIPQGRDALRRSVQSFFHPVGPLLEFDCSHTGKSFWIVLATQQIQLDTLETLLRSRLGKPLFEA